MKLQKPVMKRFITQKRCFITGFSDSTNVCYGTGDGKKGERKHVGNH